VALSRLPLQIKIQLAIANRTLHNKRSPASLK
jgi:hypothetical protein